VRNLYGHHFALKPGTRVYVPTPEGERRGREIKEEIEKRWLPPANYFHLQPGGHVAALRRHKDAPWVASLDLRRFFDQVTRSKAHRALKWIGFPHIDAWEMACDSCVDKRPPGREFSVPFGFVQSPVVASVVLEHSQLGRVIGQIERSGTPVSVYVDDLTISGADAATVTHAIDALHAAAGVCGFEFNAEKEIPTGPTATSFNIEFGSGRLHIIQDRMADFEIAVRTALPERLAGILGYVNSVNSQQHDELEHKVAP
jgi:hypothetical protein